MESICIAGCSNSWCTTCVHLQGWLIKLHNLLDYIRTHVCVEMLNSSNDVRVHLLINHIFLYSLAPGSLLIRGYLPDIARGLTIIIWHQSSIEVTLINWVYLIMGEMTAHLSTTSSVLYPDTPPAHNGMAHYIASAAWKGVGVGDSSWYFIHPFTEPCSQRLVDIPHLSNPFDVMQLHSNPPLAGKQSLFMISNAHNLFNITLS